MLWREDGRIARRAHASRAEHGAGEKTPEKLAPIREMPWKKACDFLAEEINEIQALIVRTQC